MQQGQASQVPFRWLRICQDLLNGTWPAIPGTGPLFALKDPSLSRRSTSAGSKTKKLADDLWHGKRSLRHTHEGLEASEVKKTILHNQPVNTTDEYIHNVAANNFFGCPAISFQSFSFGTSAEWLGPY